MNATTADPGLTTRIGHLNKYSVTYEVRKKRTMYAENEEQLRNLMRDLITYGFVESYNIIEIKNETE